MDRRAKGRARRAARARVAAAARRAEEDQSRDALNAVFDRFPAAVDITYYGNMLAAGANARAIRGYEFASDRYLWPGGTCRTGCCRSRRRSPRGWLARRRSRPSPVAGRSSRAW